MKKILYLIISILSITNFYAQKTYEFDYLIEYEFNIFKDSIKIKNQHFYEQDKQIHRYYLTNSKNNDYYAVITEKDSLYYKLVFIDHNGIYSNVEFLKSDLNKAEFINIDCKNVTKTTNPYKYKTKYYDLVSLKDTIINNESFWHYKMTSNKPKKKRKEKIGTTFYIIDKSSNFHLPLLTFSTLYEKWKLNKELPNGLIKEKYYENYYGRLSSNEKLIEYKKIDKKIIIPKKCNENEFIIR